MDNFDFNNNNIFDDNKDKNVNQGENVSDDSTKKIEIESGTPGDSFIMFDNSRNDTEKDSSSSYYNAGTANGSAGNGNSGSGYWKTGSGESGDPLKSSPYYTESYKKQKKGKNILQMVIVALVSSIFGGAVVGALLIFVAPSIQSPVSGYFDKLLPNKSAVNNGTGTTKVEYKIEKTDSPVTAIAEKVSPSIVGIRVTAITQDYFFQNKIQPEGSGIIIKEDGYILTNNHVIQDAIDPQTGKISKTAKIEVILPSQKNKLYTAQVIGRDPKTDMAVIKIDAKGLPAADIGNSDELKVGEMAVAIGNPGGLEFMGSVTVGVISGLNRTVMVDENKELKVIQTDASINPGNSGGALVNSEGKVIGINTLKAQTQLGFEGIGFAIPINEAKQIADSLMSSGYVKGRPFLGIEQNLDYTEDIAKMNNLPEGVLVERVIPLGGAYKAGVERGDIITKFGDQRVKNFNELNAARDKYKPGDTVTIEVYRDGNYKKLKVTLTEQKY